MSFNEDTESTVGGLLNGPTKKYLTISFESRIPRTRGISRFVDQTLLYQPALKTFHGS